MNRVPISNSARQAIIVVAAMLLAFSPAADISCLAQSSPEGIAPSLTPPKDFAPQFRIERLSVPGGAELITIFGRLDGLNLDGHTVSAESADTPLVSIVRDTLGDANPENDRLRYVWMLTYT